MFSKINVIGNQAHRELLLVLPVPFLLKDNRIFAEAQACNGLERWRENFGSVIVAAPTITETMAQNFTSFVWIDTATLDQPEQFELIPLPWAYSLILFLRHYTVVRSQLADLIKRSHYLQFAIGGLSGDWAAIAALEAHKQKRAFSIHTDRVEHIVLLETMGEASLLKILKTRLNSFLIARYHQNIIKNCTLGLWHGQNCYAAYSPFCENSYLIHDIHLKKSEQISSEQLNTKIQNILSDSILRICYAGRMESMKAPLDWVRAIAQARDLGVYLQATWMGDGSQYSQMQSLIEELNLEKCIQLTGFQSDREQLLKQIRQSHLMLFTHITPESPRCLIESLICGTPIIGYYNDYAEDLVKNHGGGQFVSLKNWQALGYLLAKLFSDRKLLAKLVQEAGINGQRFTDQQVFRERSELIKKYLA